MLSPILAPLLLLVLLAAGPVEAAFDCPVSCGDRPASDTAFCLAQYRRCPSASYDGQQVTGWDSLDEVASELLVEARNMSGVVPLSASCTNKLKLIYCAASFPVCETGDHAERLCSDVCNDLESSCPEFNSTQREVLCKQIEPMLAGESSCFRLDYGGPTYWQWVLGFLLCFVFSAGSSFALNLQKASLNEADRRPEPVPVFKQWKWCLGLCILIIGSIIDFVAYGLAPQSVLTPLGGLVLVWNVIISTCCFGEKSGAREWISTIIIFVGTGVSVIFADHYTPTYSINDITALYGEPGMICYMVFCPLFALAHYGTLVYIRKNKLSDPKHPQASRWQTAECIAYAGTAGTLGAQAILFAKQIMELLKAFSLGDNIWNHAQTYFIALAIPVFLVSNIMFLNAGLRRYSALQTVPIYQTYWMIVGTVSGLIYFKEIDEMSSAARGLFAFGIITSIVGIVILSGRKPQRIMFEADDDKPSSPALGPAADGAPNGDESLELAPLTSNYDASVAFEDYLDASARFAVGDMMMDAGFKPQSKVMQAIFVRKHSADSAELASGEAGNADRRRHTIDGDVGCLPLRRRDEGRERTQSFQGYDKTKDDEEATMARI